MNFVLVFKFLNENLKRQNIDFVLIGGFALQAAGITRTTRDIDLLVPSENVAEIKNLMLAHGYELIHESEDVLNFVGKKFDLGRVDFLVAHREYAANMLKRAEEKAVFEGRFKIKVLRIEDLIGLKVQSSSNDPKRMEQDMADIKSLIRNHYFKLDMKLVKEYFTLFNRQIELNDIIREIENADK